MGHVGADALQAGFAEVRGSPSEVGTLELIVRRPAEDERDVLEEGMLDLGEGLAGDNWQARGKVNPDAQVTVMNARLVALVAGSRERWPLAGDQLYVDLDLSAANLPPGTRLAVGEAVLV